MHPRDFPVHWLLPVDEADNVVDIEAHHSYLIDSYREIRQSTEPRVSECGTKILISRGVVASRPASTRHFEVDIERGKWRRGQRSWVQLPEHMREMAYKTNAELAAYWTDVGYLGADKDVIVAIYYAAYTSGSKLYPFIKMKQSGLWRGVSMRNKRVRERTEQLKDLLELSS